MLVAHLRKYIALFTYNSSVSMHLFDERYVSVSANGTEIGYAIVDDFFSKYGNHDGEDYVGLVAEAHLVNLLESMGYRVELVYSHNVEIRRIVGRGVDYECVGEYGEVLEDMPTDLRLVISEFARRGVNIQLDSNTGVEVLFEKNTLCRWDSGRTFSWFLESKTYAPLIDDIFTRTHEPFLIALGLMILELIEVGFGAHVEEGRLVKYNKTKEGSFVRAEIENKEGFLAAVEQALAESKINLVQHWEYGVRISNEREIMKKLGEKLSAVRGLI